MGWARTSVGCFYGLEDRSPLCCHGRWCPRDSRLQREPRRQGSSSCCRRDWLPGPGQGISRWWRKGHSHCPLPRRLCRRAERREGRIAPSLWQRRRDRRALHHPTPPYRGPGGWRQTWHRHRCGNSRVLGATALPKSARRGPSAQPPERCRSRNASGSSPALHADWLRLGRHHRVHRRCRHQRVLLPRDEHPHPSRTHRHRTGHRPRPDCTAVGYRVRRANRTHSHVLRRRSRCKPETLVRGSYHRRRRVGWPPPPNRHGDHAGHSRG